MPLQTNTNVPPYYDDYNPLNDFYRVMYRPGYPVQARELTQQQSILQNQISTLAERFMKEGDNIVPGEYGIDVPVSYVRVSSITQGSTAQDFVGWTITGVTSGVKAKVDFATAETDDDDITFFITYDDSGNTEEQATFTEGEILTSDTPNLYTAAVGVNEVSKPITSPPMGQGTLFNVSEGWFFVDGFMVRNSSETIALDKYSVTPTCQVGFLVTEGFVTAFEDPSLLDNATGNSNYAAPGADRLQITLTLTKKGLNYEPYTGTITPQTESPNFITLCTVIQGNIQGKPGDTIKWQWLYDVLAKRTFEESGDYIVTDFPIKQLEYPNTDSTNMGVFDADEDGLYPPVPFSGSTDPITFTEAEAKYSVQVSPGTAYVQGYQVQYKTPVYVFGDKSREENYRKNSITNITEGYNVTITHAYGAPDIQNIQSSANATAFDQLVLYRNFIDGYVGESTTGDPPVPTNYGQEPKTTYHLICDSSTDGQSVAGYDIVYREGRSVVVSGPDPINRGDPFGTAKVLISVTVNPMPTGVLYPRYLIPDRTINDGDGFFGYNSTSKLGIVNSQFFMELLVEEIEGYRDDKAWTVGRPIVGETSGATGVVEYFSTRNNLIVSNMVGEFIPGEEIAQNQATFLAPELKMGRIFREGDVSAFEFYDDINGNLEASIDLSAVETLEITTLGAKKTLTKAGGNFIYDADKNLLKPTKKGRNKLFNFPYPPDELNPSRINYKVVADNGALGFAVLMPAKLANTLTKTKSFYSTLGQPSTNKFSADISLQNRGDAEVLQVSDNSLFSGKKNNNYIECDSFSGDPSDELVFGDVVTFVDNGNINTDPQTVSKLVWFATAPAGYGADRAKSRIYFTTGLEFNVTGKTVQRMRVKSRGTASQNLIFQLPQDTIATLETNPEATGIDYEVYREFIQNIGANTTEFTLTTTSANASFLTNVNDVTISIIQNLSSGLDPNSLVGRTIPVVEIEQSTNDGTKADFTIDSLAEDVLVKILCPVSITNATCRKKYLKKAIVEIAGQQAREQVIALGVTDGYSLESVITTNGVDITDNYEFDNGMRDNVYDIARIKLKEGRKIFKKEANDDAKPFTVTVWYFKHDTSGDFFSVDSYTHNKGVPYRDIPYYNPVAGAPADALFTASSIISLRDCADFRPAVNIKYQEEMTKERVGTPPWKEEAKLGTYYPSVLSPVTKDIGVLGSYDSNNGRLRIQDTNYRDALNNGNGTAPRMPVPNSRFRANITYYMARYDSLFLEKNGALTLVKGVPSNSPQPPADLSTGIRLYDLYLPPYTFAADNINVKKFNYKRYRMKDIAKIERRIDRIEELVTLSILEQSALNMSVRDAVTGLDRFKNGIVADNFRDHSKGAVGDQQYRNSIDPKTTHLRSPAFVDQPELVEIAQSDAERAEKNYTVNNGIATCTYTTVDFIDQPFATRTINLQPFSVFTYDGSLDLYPPIDTFQDINILPDLVIEDNNVFDAMVNLTGDLLESGIGTVWGGWENTGRISTSVNNTVQNLPGTAASINAIAGANVANFPNGGAGSINSTSNTSSTDRARQQSVTFLDVTSAQTVETSYGERVVDVALARTMRARPVKIVAQRMKPNTRYYAFFDGIDVNEWIAPDVMRNGSLFPDDKKRYLLVRGQSYFNSKGFGKALYSDAVGNITATFLIPNGQPPIKGKVYEGAKSLTDDSFYQTGQPSRTFTTGTKIFRLTSSETNVDISDDQLEGFAESSFTASGVILDKQETIVSTRVPIINPVTVNLPAEPEPNDEDPVAQTFQVDRNNKEGVFVTELDVYFKEADPSQSVMAYLVTTDGEVPTREKLPHSRIVKNPASILRTVVKLPSGSSAAVTLKKGTAIVGKKSGATGIIKSNVKFNSTSTNTNNNVTNTVYNVLLSNYVGEFLPGEQFETTSSKESDVKNTTFTIAKNEVDVDSLEITDMGSGYNSNSTVEFTAPQLPGGETATGQITVSAIAGNVYKIELLTPGSGYTKAPGVTINGNGNEATAIAKVTPGADAVTMGVCTSDDGTAATTFRFEAPVYLVGNTWYAFVVKSPNSMEYKLWCSKMGENQVGTETRVNEQPNTGSLFMSQNGGLWTEDQTQDVKFKIKRASFDANKNALVTLQNAPITTKRYPKNPIETAEPPSAGHSVPNVFEGDARVVRVYCYHHGLETGDYVALSGVSGSIGDIPASDFNDLHEVLHSTLDMFTIKVATDSTKADRGGGNSVSGSYNNPYQVLDVYTGVMQFGSSTFEATARTIEAAGYTGYNSLMSYTLNDPNSIVLMDSYYYNGAKQVANYLNELKYDDPFHLQGQKSLLTSVLMSTNNEKVSPVLDLTRTNATVITNLVDNPQSDDEVYGEGEIKLRLNSDASAVTSVVAGGDINWTDSKSVARVASIKSVDSTNKRVVIAGSFAKYFTKASTLSDAALAAIGVDNVSVASADSYNPETKNNGSCYSKWISRLFVFENACDGMEIKCSSIFYGNTVKTYDDEGYVTSEKLVCDNIRVYYKPQNIGFDGELANVNWIPINIDGVPDQVEQIKPRSSEDVDPRRLKSGDWQLLTWSVQDIAQFDGMAIKIVMTANNPALAPLIDDVQIVCSE